MEIGKVLKKLSPEDLIKYGLIPEFVGRLPVSVGLENLNEDALVQILTEPKNSLEKQYQALFKLDNVSLEFEKEALRAIAKKALNRKTGARGLRAILEEIMMDIMFLIPSDDSIEKCIITKDTVEKSGEPIIISNENLKALKQNSNVKKRLSKKSEDVTA